MEKPRVAVSHCQSPREADAAVNQLLGLLGWDKVREIIRPGCTVLLKPNLVCAKRPSSGVVTHPEVVEAMVKIVKSLGANPVIGDGPAYGCGGDFFGVSGLKAVGARHGVRLIDLNKDDPVEVKLEGAVALKTTYVSKTALEADCIVNLPVLKTCTTTLMTLSLKNMKGILVGKEKHKPHLFGMAEGIVEVNRIAPTKLTIVDGIVGLEGEGPTNGTPANAQVMFAGFDPVAVDAVGFQIAGFSAYSTALLPAAERAGLGHIEAEMVGEPLEAVRRQFVPPNVWRDAAPGTIFGWADPMRDWFADTFLGVKEDKCNLCGVCVRACPTQVMSIVDKHLLVDQKGCIGCLCCQEVCPLGAIYLTGEDIRSGYLSLLGANNYADGLMVFDEMEGEEGK